MQVHIWPSRTRSVDAANAAIRVQASWVAWSPGTGTVWKWSYTQTDSHGPASALRARSRMTVHCRSGSIPTRSCRQPWGTKIPNLMAVTLAEGADPSPGQHLVRHLGDAPGVGVDHEVRDVVRDQVRGE